MAKMLYNKLDSVSDAELSSVDAELSSVMDDEFLPPIMQLPLDIYACIIGSDREVYHGMLVVKPWRESLTCKQIKRWKKRLGYAVEHIQGTTYHRYKDMLQQFARDESLASSHLTYVR
jgi:hypothetical protein